MNVIVLSRKNEVVVRITIEVPPSCEFHSILIQTIFRTVDLMVSTISSSGRKIKRVRVNRASNVQLSHSETISLLVACTGKRVVRAGVKECLLRSAKASLQIMGYYCNAALIETGQEITYTDNTSSYSIN